ncbi:ribonucleases G and E [Candidatus Scalindua japonica]|uniref:Ribonucleases G and E n=1 Tax=Candidatus Scalindua japonica TaxID=1284222 RepID=A0A286TWE5_9BACT|nr:hypothetical protein [Candidatus Scalindua japonica]GAX60151.1 ribonucleases G and E [Candidatus Scalindua japonica]
MTNGNFLTRLISRTQRPHEVVQPLVEPIFANDVTFGYSFPNRPQVDDKTLDLDEKAEDTKFTDREESTTSKAYIHHTNREFTRTTITGKSSPFDRSFGRQTNSKDNGASEADKLINNNPLLPENKMVKEMSGFPMKSESHDVLSTGPRIKRVFPKHVETSKNIILPETPDSAITHAYTEENKEQKLHLKPKKQSGSDSLSNDRNFQKATSEHSEYQPILNKNFQNHGKEIQSLTPLTDNGFHQHVPSSIIEQTRPNIRDNFSTEKGLNSTTPMIKVTIGRIDVHAVTQQTQQPRRRATPPKPKLTLDDYLKQRCGGRQ